MFFPTIGQQKNLNRIYSRIYSSTLPTPPPPTHTQSIGPSVMFRNAKQSLLYHLNRSTYCINYKLESKHPYCKGTWADKLNPAKPICVECHERAMNKGGKCNGHGSLGEITSWFATDLYSCGGQWMRISPRINNCECNQKIFNNFIFV